MEQEEEAQHYDGRLCDEGEGGGHEDEEAGGGGVIKQAR